MAIMRTCSNCDSGAESAAAHITEPCRARPASARKDAAPAVRLPPAQERRSVESWPAASVEGLSGSPVLAIGVLFLLEQLLWICLPLALGLAVNGLVHASWAGLLLLAGVTAALLVAGTVRRVYVPRLVRRMASAVSMGAVASSGEVRQREGTAAGRQGDSVATRWLTAELPEGVRLVCGTAGAMLILAQYDVLLPLWCLAWLLPVWLLDSAFRQLDGSTGGGLDSWSRRPYGHAGGESQLQVWLQPAGFVSVSADAAAARFSLTLLLGLGVLVGALVQYCCGSPSAAGPAAGDVLAVVGYLLLYLVTALELPGSVQRVRARRQTPLSHRAAARG